MNTESQAANVKRGTRNAERGVSGGGTSNIQRPTPNIQWGKAGQDEEFLTKKELAARLKVSLRTIEQWQHDGHLPYIKVSVVILFHWPEVVAHLRAKYRVAGTMGES